MNVIGDYVYVYGLNVTEKLHLTRPIRLSVLPFSTHPLTCNIENYKTWRVNVHEVCDITIRHDLHALSKFFQYAIRQHWTRENPIRNIKRVTKGCIYGVLVYNYIHDHPPPQFPIA
jgi:hypothetical protein